MNYQDLLHSPIVPSKIVPLIEKATQNQVPVLILGEQGTGKELVAKIIHHLGERKEEPFHKIDCKFLTEEALRDQLHRILKEVGDTNQMGTLYLKEVGFLEEGNQLQILELLEDLIFQTTMEGSVTQSPRFISSSSENLEAKVTQGRFSEDLYDRLSTLSVHIPPLRDRAEEISAIAHYLLMEHSKKMKTRKLGIAAPAIKLLESYGWPGNTKELERIILRSAIFSEGEHLTDRDLFFEIENEKSAFADYLRKMDTKPTPTSRPSTIEESLEPPLPLFFIELVHRIKNPLVSIKTFTQLLREKFNDAEFREYFYRIVTEDIDKIDSVLDGLLNYIKINTPIRKMNTVHTILEEILRKYERPFEEKKIKLFKKFQKNLPETILHDEQLRYVLNSIVKYATPSIPPDGSIGFLTKSCDLQKETGDAKALSEREGRWIEILIIFTGYKRSTERLETALGTESFAQEETIELELRLVKEIIRKNRGIMRLEVSEKRPRTLISIRLPVERREVVYYPSTNG